MNEILITMNEDGVFEEYKEPYTTVAFETEEDFRGFEKILEEHNERQWIPCSERLPEERVDVLVSFGDEYPVIAWYSEINNHWKNSSTDIPISMDVIAWMPLPEPYKESED